ncbi:cation diffusion facilitator family transporter [Fructilactobacillus myrtifloralis]|uniref:Cation diffusion facilitator family transporter n=1 Tax=Fructilactobacillus myrtifloralis TaxID=2940301 RepID=A0ABY5BSV8_9LACO|nr:cation diffusion facilitator family transporter [Fructilactobacillus myrtifloralis]USS85676.1 cation diffusion facilitator family transporter [Fructilactobacillus myrtifloralis]
MSEREEQLTGRRFLSVTLLNSAITLLEFIGGLLSGSLSLLSDAAHNLGDSLSIIFSYGAHVLSKRKQTRVNTYGFKRAEILAALFNSLFLVLLSLFLLGEAVSRLWHPAPVESGVMIWVAVISAAANLLSTVLLNRGAQHNLNLKATYLHLLSDALASLGIIVGGGLILWTGWTFIDPLITMIVAVYIMLESLPVIKKTVSILMECAPHLDYAAINRDLLAIPGVKKVHHVHALMVDENSIVFSAHVNMDNMELNEVQQLYAQINRVLKDRYQIDHVTIQPETTQGADEAFFYDRDYDI